MKTHRKWANNLQASVCSVNICTKQVHFLLLLWIWDGKDADMLASWLKQKRGPLGCIRCFCHTYSPGSWCHCNGALLWYPPATSPPPTVVDWNSLLEDWSNLPPPPFPNCENEGWLHHSKKKKKGGGVRNWWRHGEALLWLSPWYCPTWQ